MVITFPHLGNIYLAAKVFFEELKVPCVIPKPNSKETLKTGAYISPEEICLPFKLIMGNFLDCIKRGADTIIITGSCGPCRFGEYCELQMKILKKNGYNADIIVIDSPSEIGRQEFWERIGRVTAKSRAGRAEKLNCLRQTLSILKQLDGIDAMAYDICGYEAEKGTCKRLLAECKDKAYLCNNFKEIRCVLSEYKKSIKSICVCNTKTPLKIALIGEIYTMIEPFSNLYIEEKLAGLGVCTKRFLTPSWWVKDLLLKPVRLNSPLVRAASKKYLPCEIGGHAKESIAHTVRSAFAGFDGAIQVFPLGCMPEIVTKSVLPSLQEELQFPVLTLIVDEITGEAGYMTRIEAFVDMLESKRSRRQYA